MSKVETLSASSEFWEKCARHSGKYTARTMHYRFLCDPCRTRLTNEALNGRPPIFCDDPISGFCGLCNDLLDVRFCQWFLCPICANVIGAYPKAFVSVRGVFDFWNKTMAPSMETFLIEETDPVQLVPYVRVSRTKREAAEHVDRADFLVSEVTGDTRLPRFHIELKAGPGSIDSMRDFQLDVNDYNDIVGTAVNTGLPVYVFHMQLGVEYLLPTMRSVAVNLWWTDFAKLKAALLRKATRRDESKAALYFDTAAFQPIGTFSTEIETRGFETLRRELLRSPPSMM